MSQTPFQRFVVVEFDCKHRREFPAKGNIPPVGDTMICLRCREAVKVAKHLEEYRVRCSDCRYSRPFGAAKTRAEIAASKHHNRYPYHEVKLWLGARTVHVWKRNEQHLFAKALQSKRPSGVDEYPF